jgi:hypothetical protein
MVVVARIRESANAGRRSQVLRYERNGVYALEKQDPRVVEGLVSRVRGRERMKLWNLTGWLVTLTRLVWQGSWYHE